MKRYYDAFLKYIKKSDMLLLILCCLSTSYGMLLIYSSTKNDHGQSFLNAQIAAAIVGIILYVFFSLIDIDIFAEKSKLLYVLSVILISTLLIWGVSGESGNRAWLRFGGVGGIQPAEVVKVPFIIVIARMIATYRDRRNLNSPLSILKIVLVFGSLFGLILVVSSDLGSALVYSFILLVMLFIGGVKLRWFLIAGGAIGAIIPFLWTKMPMYQKARILSPYDSSWDPTGLVYLWQPNQSKSAIAAGKFTGEGLFHGYMTQAGSIPQQHTDFIFSVAGEELGFIGCLLILLLLIAIIIRCIYVGVKSNSTLGLLVCSGVAAMLIFQTFENIGMCLGLTPVIGLTLPLFSYGGSSIITNFAAMGIVSGIKMRPKPIRFRSM